MLGSTIIALYFMSVDTWGLLPKAQDNPETIEEAIVRLIGDHNDDSEAHLDTGQSLAVHRENEILDHPSSSIVSDKFSSDDRMLMLPTSADVDVTFDNQSSYALGLLVSMYKNSPSTGDAVASLLNFQLSDMGYVSGDIVFDFLFSADNGSGTAHAEFIVQFASVYVDNGHYKLGWYDGSWHYTSLVSFTQLVAQKWRIHYSAVDNTIYYFLNGTLIHSQVQTPTFASSDYMIDIKLNRGTTTNSSVFFGGINVGFSTS